MLGVGKGVDGEKESVARLHPIVLPKCNHRVVMKGKATSIIFTLDQHRIILASLVTREVAHQASA